jgi:hypothetical protein
MTDSASTSLTPDQRNSFLAALLGWTMDAFDYFIVVFVYADIAHDFGVSLTRMAFLTTATLIMRPVGAIVFDIWADRRGRRIPLLVDWLFALSIIPALISLFIRSRVRESEVWSATQERMRATNSSFRDVLLNPVVLRRFGYLILLMTAFNWLSHGAQDLYPTFLKASDDGGAGGPLRRHVDLDRGGLQHGRSQGIEFGGSFGTSRADAAPISGS